MPEFAEVIYNITDCYVAALGSDNAYGTPAPVQYIGKCAYETESDNDEIKSKGMIVERLAIPTKINGTINEASLNWASASILLGWQSTSSGDTPNRIVTLDHEMGDAGLPYFGLIAAYAAINGANLIVGFCKAQLDTVPAFDVDQNTFRTAETNFTAIVGSDTVRKAVRHRRYETVGGVPTTAGGFDTFFAGMFS